MIINRSLTVCFVLLFGGISERAFAFGMPVAMPLSQTIEQSESIAIVSLVSYQAGNPPPETGIAVPGGGMVYVGPSVFTSHPFLKPAGHYVFHIIKTLKGTLSTTIDIDLPYILYMYYGGARLTIQKGSVLIVFLQGITGYLVPTDTTTPFVPLTDGSITGRNDSTDIQDEVYTLMLASCSDETIRQADTYLLRTATLPKIVAGFPYLILALQDPDPNQDDKNVSYVAYKTLDRLIPSIGTAQSSDRYFSDRSDATQPIYDWWQDELNGKHVTTK